MVITTDIALRGGDEKRVERAGAGDGDKQPHAGQVTVRASAKTGTAGAGITVVRLWPGNDGPYAGNRREAGLARGADAETTLGYPDRSTAI